MRSFYLFSALFLSVLATYPTDQVVLTGFDCEVTNTRPLDWEGTHYGPSQGRDGGYGTTYADGRLFEFACGSCTDSQGHTGSYVTCGYSWMNVEDLEYPSNQLVITDVITESRSNAVGSCEQVGYTTAFTYASTTARDTDDNQADKFRICYKLRKWSDVILERLEIVTAMSARSAISVIQSQRTSKRCSQDWTRDYHQGQFHVSLDACKQSCVADPTCTGISWSDSHDDRCVKCHGPMQYTHDQGWVTFDKEAGNAPELPAFPGDFGWSWAGAVPGQHCVWIGDHMNHWHDNFLCTSGDKANPGFRYSQAGPIQNENMKCINIHEPSAPSEHTWADNYFCYPNDSPYEFQWSYAGPIAGLDCIAVYDPTELDNHAENTWDDNYLCATRTAVPDGSSCNAQQVAKCTSFPCVDLRQDFEHHHIMSYVAQGKAKIIYYTSDLIAGGSSWTCSCTGCEANSLVGTWNCVDDVTNAIFYGSNIVITSDYADNFLPQVGNHMHRQQFRHLDVCKQTNLIGKFDTYNDPYANMCNGNPYAYCNSYHDLKRDFCGGATCTENTAATCTFANNVQDCCKIHFEKWGNAEILAGTRALPTCGQFESIDTTKACHHNSEGIVNLFGSYGFTFETCKQKCVATTECVAIDFYHSSGWCSTYDRACTTPATTWDGASSWKRITTSRPTMCNGDALAYCESYPDLKNAFCGGSTCTENDRVECTHHFDNWGKNEIAAGIRYKPECGAYVPKAYGDDTRPNNFISLFTHKAEPDVGDIVLPPKVIGIWKVWAYNRNDVMDIDETLTLYAESSTGTTVTKTELAAVSSELSQTHRAEIAVEGSAEYLVASASTSALYSYEYAHAKSAQFENQLSSVASQTFSQGRKVEKHIHIPKRTSPSDSYTVNVWYFQTEVVGGPPDALEETRHFILSQSKPVYDCGHHIPPNCLPSHCKHTDPNCWECTEKWAEIDPNFRKPAECDEPGEGGEYVAIPASECPPSSIIQNELAGCNTGNFCGELCEADGPIPGSNVNPAANNCGAHDVFRYVCT